MRSEGGLCDQCSSWRYGWPGDGPRLGDSHPRGLLWCSYLLVSFFESTGLGSAGRRFFSTGFLCRLVLLDLFRSMLASRALRGFQPSTTLRDAFLFLEAAENVEWVVIFSLTGGEDGKKEDDLWFSRRFHFATTPPLSFLLLYRSDGSTSSKADEEKSKRGVFPKVEVPWLDATPCTTPFAVSTETGRRGSCGWLGDAELRYNPFFWLSALDGGAVGRRRLTCEYVERQVPVNRYTRGAAVPYSHKPRGASPRSLRAAFSPAIAPHGI